MTPLELYQKHLPNLRRSQGREWKTLCPFHEEKTASFFINDGNGFFYCFGCGKSGGITTFLQLLGASEELETIVRDETLKSYTIQFSEPISPVVVQQLHRNLLNDLDALEYVLRERMISMFVVKKFLIGYDPETDRIAFPIKSNSGNFVNIKLHNSYKIPKSLSWGKGTGKPRLFPFSATLRSDIVICEGEFDCLLLHTHGINGITSTSGSQSFEPKFDKFFLGKSVKILYDSDRAGTEGAEGVRQTLSDHVRKIEVINYPDELKATGKVDVTNFVKLGGDLYQLLGMERRK